MPYCALRAWCKTIVTISFYIRSYNSFAPSPRHVLSSLHLTACFSFLSNSGSGFEAFVKETGELIISVFGKKEHFTVEVPDSAKTMLDGHWVRNDQLILVNFMSVKNIKYLNIKLKL